MKRTRFYILVSFVIFLICYAIYDTAKRNENQLSVQRKSYEKSNTVKEPEITANGKTRTETTNKLNSNTSLTLNKDQIEYMDKMIKQGYIAYELSSHEVYISPILWKAMDYKLKEDVTVSCAEYCAMKNGNNLVYIAVFDKQSGKKIAKYSQVWGYEVL